MSLPEMNRRRVALGLVALAGLAVMSACTARPLYSDAGLQTGAAIDLAARQGAGDVLAQQRLDDAQLVGQPEMQVEETRINRPQLKIQRALADSHCSCRKTGHAVYASHAIYSLSGCQA